MTEVLFGLPDRLAGDEIAGYVERLAGKLAALVGLPLIGHRL